MDELSPPVRVSRSGAVGTLTLSRPENGNALGVAMAEALNSSIRQVADDPTIRCVLLTGEGRFFCVGGDVKSMGATDDVGPLLDRITMPLHEAVATLLRMDKPVVIAVNGPVAGGGLGFALAGDIVIAAQSAHFSLAYAGIGFSPDGASSWLLPRLIGMRRTQELALLNKRLSSAEAAELGLVTRVVADEQLIADATATAEAIASGPVAAFAATRRLLLSSWSASPEEQMAAEATSVRIQGAGPEGREGLAAFLGKRPADFSARP